MSSEHPLNVLFLCTGNSARSILAEVMMNTMGAPRFKAYSAGSHPNGRVNLLPLSCCKRTGCPWKVCEARAGRICRARGARARFRVHGLRQRRGRDVPIPQASPHGNWGVENPAAVEGSDDDKRKAFFHAYNRLHNRIQLFVSLPLAKLDRIALTEPLEGDRRSRRACPVSRENPFGAEIMTTQAVLTPRPAVGMSVFERYLTVWVRCAS